jgi:hypothetical protein
VEGHNSLSSSQCITFVLFKFVLNGVGCVNSSVGYVYISVRCVYSGFEYVYIGFGYVYSGTDYVYRGVNHIYRLVSYGFYSLKTTSRGELVQRAAAFVSRRGNVRKVEQ